MNKNIFCFWIQAEEKAMEAMKELKENHPKLNIKYIPEGGNIYPYKTCKGRIVVIMDRLHEGIITTLCNVAAFSEILIGDSWFDIRPVHDPLGYLKHIKG